MGTFVRWILAIVAVGVVAAAGFAFYLTSLNADPVQKPERQMSDVWANYPFRSHYIAVNGARMHYIDEGRTDGPVFLFLHGNPTSSYLWRNVVPAVAASGARAIAVDNIGFGASDRPDIGYTFAEHSTYIDGFIEAMALKDITLVVHDWGSALGFDYAFRHQGNVKGIVFMESVIRVPSMSELPTPPWILFNALRTKGVGEFIVMGGNGSIERLLPLGVARKLSEEEKNAYREPFPSFGSRYPLLAWPRQIPFDGSPADVAARVRSYAEWLPTSDMPKLLLYVEGGLLIPKARAEEIARDWKNLDAKFLGTGAHFVQEDHGPDIGAAIVAWRAAKFPEAPTAQPAAPADN